MYQLRENRDMNVRAFIALVGSTLYDHRFSPFYINPVIAGLEKGEPIIASSDYIGCMTVNEDFACDGTAGDNFLGLMESYSRKDLSPQELSDITANVLLSGIDRDIMSGWGAMTFLMTEDGIQIKNLKTKQV